MSMITSKMRGSIMLSMMCPLSSMVEVGTAPAVGRLAAPAGADRHARRLDAIAQRGGGSGIALGSVGDSPADVDQQPGALPVEAGGDRPLQGAALGADAGDQQRGVRSARTDGGDGIDGGRPDDEPDRAARVPANPEVGDAQVEGLA